MSGLWRGDEDNLFYYGGIIIRQILQHLDLWEQKLSRDPPEWEPFSENRDVVSE